MNAWELINNVGVLDYGRDTASWNRAKILGAIKTFKAITLIMGPDYARLVMEAMPVELLLAVLNEDNTDDNITLREVK